VQRNQTVRGAVRGTTREAGANPHLVQRALTRGKTLTRPERFVAPAPLINPGNSSGGAAYTTLVNGVPTLTRNEPFWDPWGIFVNVITFWAPGVLLSAVGLKDKFKQRAWKEKVALCSIAIMLGGVVGFVTIGLTRVLCPVNGTKTASAFTRLGAQAGESILCHGLDRVLTARCRIRRDRGVEL
jgi:chitin synthase